MRRLEIPGGYLPVPSGGDWIAFGNGTVSLANWRTGDIRRDMFDGYAAGWFNNRTLAVSIPRSSTHRELVYLDIHTRIPVLSGTPWDQQPGYFPQIAVHGRTVVSSIPGQHFVNGQPVPTEPEAQRIEDFDGLRYCYKVATGDPWPLRVKNIRYPRPVPDGLIAPVTNARLEWNDCVTANLDGRMVVWNPEASQTWKGPAGESRGLMCWSDYDERDYVVTGVIDNWQPVWLFRPFEDWRADEPAIIVRGIGHQGMRVQNTPEGWLCMGYIEAFGGVLTMDLVPYDSPRNIYRPTPEPEKLTDVVILAVPSDLPSEDQTAMLVQSPQWQPLDPPPPPPMPVFRGPSWVKKLPKWAQPSKAIQRRLGWID